ncbi:MAG TPA: cysteine-rich CWC family protein [Taishania sp.]|nr:cysteine-rich CWC family protein [Taishania sp.]HNS41226.1 cysteine-rich CWC family protein [Taishania sp.]
MKIKKCQRCKVDFECNAEDIVNCFCNTITLSVNEQPKEATSYTDCLCKKCLLEMDQNTSELTKK